MADPTEPIKRPHVLVLYALGRSRVEDQDVHVQGNNDIWRLLDPGRYQVDRLILRPERMAMIKAMDLARYDVVINAISDPDVNADGLDLAEHLCRDLNRPVINHPKAVRQTDRAQVAQALSDIDGLVVPQVLKKTGQELIEKPLDDRLPWPLLLRPVGRHGAVDLHRVDTQEALAEAVPTTALDQDFYLTQFVDFRRAEGRYWKTRLMIIDGEPMVRHVVISDHWISNMTQHDQQVIDADKTLAEETQEMQQAQAFFTSQAGRQMVKMITEGLRLDYIGMDCSRLDDGRWLVFEANAAMNMLPLSEPQAPIYIDIVRMIARMTARMVDNRLASAG
ncbi:MAG: hypothetical protein AAF213_04645 [Pseudomonadota bacterium]